MRADEELKTLEDNLEAEEQVNKEDKANATSFNLKDIQEADTLDEIKESQKSSDSLVE